MTISATTQGLRQGVCTSGNRPASPFEGQMIYETDTDLTLIWGGSAWQQVSGGTAVGNSGLVYVKSQTVGSAVASVTVSDAFSATYDNYKVQYSGACSLTTGNVIDIRLGATATGYYGTMIYASYAGAGPSVVGDNNVVAWTHCAGAARSQFSLDVDFYNPFKTQITTMGTTTYTDQANAGKKSGWLDNTTSYTSFVLYAASGTFTGGTVTVYGYRK